MGLEIPVGALLYYAMRAFPDDFKKSKLEHHVSKVMRDTFHDEIAELVFWKFSMTGDVPIFIQPIPENEELIDYMMTSKRFHLVDQECQIKCRGTIPSGYVRLGPITAYKISKMNQKRLTRKGEEYASYPKEIEKVVHPNW